MAIGILIIILQPFKSTKVNTYHTILLLIMAIECLSITLIDEAETKARWTIRIAVPVVAIFYVSPNGILVVIVYAVFRCYRRCHTVWFKYYRNMELENLMTGNRNRENYQAI